MLVETADMLRVRKVVNHENLIVGLVGGGERGEGGGLLKIVLCRDAPSQLQGPNPFIYHF